MADKDPNMDNNIKDDNVNAPEEVNRDENDDLSDYRFNEDGNPEGLYKLVKPHLYDDFQADPSAESESEDEYYSEEEEEEDDDCVDEISIALNKIMLAKPNILKDNPLQPPVAGKNEKFLYKNNPFFIMSTKLADRINSTVLSGPGEEAAGGNNQYNGAAWNQYQIPADNADLDDDNAEAPGVQPEPDYGYEFDEDAWVGGNDDIEVGRIAQGLHNFAFAFPPAFFIHDVTPYCHHGLMLLPPPFYLPQPTYRWIRSGVVVDDTIFDSSSDDETPAQPY